MTTAVGNFRLRKSLLIHVRSGDESTGIKSRIKRLVIHFIGKRQTSNKEDEPMSTIPHLFFWVQVERREKERAARSLQAVPSPTGTPELNPHSTSRFNRYVQHARRFPFHQVKIHSSTTFSGCPVVQIAKERSCSFIPNDFPYFEVFEAICKQHQLCYACGIKQGLTQRKCNALSRMYMYEQCLKNYTIEPDCLRQRVFALISLQEDIYRLSDFPSECHEHCMLNYLLSNPSNN
ncbi:unnamed protein product [Adineta ricciae]|uniref:Uncharacterized protein n=1 Tax=Adineta ricciae TaxID=249248 RepID=A0A816AK38_ADIRI|nr:unnamed protein product [Adineta ricciae]